MSDLYAAVAELADRQERGEPCTCEKRSGHAGWLTCAQMLAAAGYRDDRGLDELIGRLKGEDGAA